MNSIKDDIKALRGEVKTLMEKFNTVGARVCSQIPSSEGMEIDTDLGKLQFYLVDDVCQGFSNTMTALHKLWMTFPEAK